MNMYTCSWLQVNFGYMTPDWQLHVNLQIQRVAREAA